ncbi:replication protein A1-like protein [Trifolium medium]|uniref:Replication protein A1-like protein n=1 Tax=Trifolium medium TaxID=97028 RepID=A0A392NRB1_9FABA|nr:replication protein A1-like protein [Trifolium medium]
MFSDDFGEEIGRVASLVDSKENQFECLVEKINGNVYFTLGWGALRDFYDIRFGAWLMLLYMGGGQFGLILHDRFHQHVDSPLFTPPMKFAIDMMLPYDGFGEYAFEEDATTIKLVDDCGNKWNCTLVYVTFPFKHFKVGGEWSRLVAARRLAVGESVTVGAQANGHSQAIYLLFDP